MSSNANDPAYPHHKEDSHGFPVMGLTKRELFAAMASVGHDEITDMVGSMFRVSDGNFAQRHAAEAALRVRKADALLAELGARK